MSGVTMSWEFRVVFKPDGAVVETYRSLSAARAETGRRARTRWEDPRMGELHNYKIVKVGLETREVSAIVLPPVAEGRVKPEMPVLEPVHE